VFFEVEGLWFSFGFSEPFPRLIEIVVLLLFEAVDSSGCLRFLPFFSLSKTGLAGSYVGTQI
jgi:hypothetical protein